MAGTVHDVENKTLLTQVRQEAADAAQQLMEASHLRKGQIVVVGCSTSEVAGQRAGQAQEVRRIRAGVVPHAEAVATAFVVGARGVGVALRDPCG